MGTIIGDGITFDDVLLVPAYSEVIPNQVDLTTNLTKTIKCRYGYGNRAPHGHCHGKTGRYRYHPQEYVDRGTGGRGG